MHDVTDLYQDSQLSVIAYHMNWPAPGNDPWYHHNATHNNHRRSYYGVNAIPVVVVNGTSQPDPWQINAMQSAVNGFLAQDSPIQLSMEVEFADNQIQATVTLIVDSQIHHLLPARRHG